MNVKQLKEKGLTIDGFIIPVGALKAIKKLAEIHNPKDEVTVLLGNEFEHQRLHNIFRVSNHAYAINKSEEQKRINKWLTGYVGRVPERLFKDIDRPKMETILILRIDTATYRFALLGEKNGNN